jgi:crossover junction endodeoxyribonuclease RusA
MNDIAIPLPWQRPPITLNDRADRRSGGHRKIAQALSEARMAIRVAGIRPIVGAEVTLHYRVPDNRRRDADNLAATLKVCQDALVQEGVLPDDSWVSVPSATCRIHAPEEEPAMWVELTAVTEFAEAAT